MTEDFIIQGNVNIFQSNNETEKQENVKFVDKVLQLQNHLQRNFAQAIVFTKQEFDSLSSELSKKIIEKNLSQNRDTKDILYAIPISLLKRELRNSNQENVIRKIKVKEWEEMTIYLSLMEGLKIKDALEEATGNKSEKMSIEEIIRIANYAGRLVDEKKFNVVISYSTNNQETIYYLTLLFCTLYAMQNSTTVQNLIISNFHYLYAKECLRVLKPGGHLLSFGGTRTYHRMTCNIEDAGFEIRDMICWAYGSGFPKSLSVGKASVFKHQKFIRAN